MAPRPEQIAVLGAGTMGAGIAQVAALAGDEVRLFDVSAEARDAGGSGSLVELFSSAQIAHRGNDTVSCLCQFDRCEEPKPA